MKTSAVIKVDLAGGATHRILLGVETVTMKTRLARDPGSHTG